MGYRDKAYEDAKINPDFVTSKPLKVLTGVERTLSERGNRYGDFNEHARITQSIKNVMRATKNWDTLTHPMRESLDMIAHKIGRILNGDPTYADSWHDIAGYAKLVDDILSERARQAASAS